MNRREYLKSMLIMAGAASLGLIRPAPAMVRLIVTDPQGKVTRTTRPVEVMTGAGDVWHTHNMLDPMPAWEKGALPSAYFVNPRLERPLVRFFAERWA